MRSYLDHNATARVRPEAITAIMADGAQAALRHLRRRAGEVDFHRIATDGEGDGVVHQRAERIVRDGRGVGAIAIVSRNGRGTVHRGNGGRIS